MPCRGENGQNDNAIHRHDLVLKLQTVTGVIEHFTSLCRCLFHSNKTLQAMAGKIEATCELKEPPCRPLFQLLRHSIPAKCQATKLSEHQPWQVLRTRYVVATLVSRVATRFTNLGINVSNHFGLLGMPQLI